MEFPMSIGIDDLRYVSYIKKSFYTKCVFKTACEQDNVK